MDEKKEKKPFRSALKSVVEPLLIGLRNEVKKLTEKIEAGQASTQKTEVTNFPEQRDEIKVSNLPETQKVEVTNPQEQVNVKGLGEGLSTLKEAIVKRLTTTSDSIVNSIKELGGKTLSVKITNQKEIKFPKTQGVKLSDADMQTLIKGIKQEVQRVQIENSQPGEAVPVVLTDRDRRRFVEAFMNVTGGANLGNIKALLGDIVAGVEDDDAYVAFDVAVTSTEQEVDFGSEFTSFAISVGKGTGASGVLIRLNDGANDQILIESQGFVANDRFKISKVFLQTQGGTNNVTIFATKKI